jgi:hypothetical protein
MREHQHAAVALRDRQLGRIRKLSLLIGAAAAAASVGLGTAFAHTLPGHSHPASPGRPHAARPNAGAGNAAGGPDRSSTRQHRSHGERPKLAAPSRQPAHSTAPPVVSSGGS